MDADDRVVVSRPVEDMLNALGQPALPHELAGERDAVAAIAERIRATAPTEPARSAPVRTRSRLALAAVFAAAALTACSGLAFAGELPGAAQSTAADMLAKLGVSVPGANPHAGTHPDSRGASTAAHPGSDAASAPAETGDGTSLGDAGSTDQGSTNGKGAEVSQLARTTTLTGRDKGAAISTLASGGKSHAGNPPGQANNGSGATGNSGSRPSHPSHPSHPDTPSGGSQRGGTGADHSGGHSTAGAGNRPS